MDELKKCKRERRLLLITLWVLILIYFSFPIAKIFQPKKIVIENAEGEKYRFNIPWDWIYWKSDDRNYVFYNIWNKKAILLPVFNMTDTNLLWNFRKNVEKHNDILIEREFKGFLLWEVKKNPNYSEDDGEVFFIPKLNCFILYRFRLSEKEKIIKKFLSGWERVE